MDEVVKDQKIQEIINNLISGETLNSFYGEDRVPEFNIDGFSGIALNDNQKLDQDNSEDRDLKNYSDRVELFWEQLLLRLKEKNEIKEKSKYGIREINFPTEQESLVSFINKNCDLDKQDDSDFYLFFDNYIEGYLEDKNNNAHWNESVAKLAEYYYNYFKKNNSDEKIKDTNYSISDLLNADAANSFEKEEEWVKPWKRFRKILENSGEEIEENYKIIRDNDRIERILTDEKNLQYTSKKEEDSNSYLRLIMPEYKRIVEIEDLNRNFWVIGQSLSAICAFLFDKENSIPRVLEALLDEIIQMWEEIFKLWIKVLYFYQKEDFNDFQILFLPVSSKQDTILKYFDNFIDDNINLVFNSEKTIVEKSREILNYLWEKYFYGLRNKYDKSIIIIIPEIRDINYGENYYARSIYPGVIIYNRRKIISVENRLSCIPFNKLIIADAKYQSISLIE